MDDVVGDGAEEAAEGMTCAGAVVIAAIGLADGVAVAVSVDLDCAVISAEVGGVVVGESRPVLDRPLTASDGAREIVLATLDEARVLFSVGVGMVGGLRAELRGK